VERQQAQARSSNLETPIVGLECDGEVSLILIPELGLHHLVYITCIAHSFAILFT
jgi:hypothetical protein